MLFNHIAERRDLVVGYRCRWLIAVPQTQTLHVFNLVFQERPSVVAPARRDERVQGVGVCRASRTCRVADTPRVIDTLAGCYPIRLNPQQRRRDISTTALRRRLYVWIGSRVLSMRRTREHVRPAETGVVRKVVGDHKGVADTGRYRVRPARSTRILHKLTRGVVPTISRNNDPPAILWFLYKIVGGRDQDRPRQLLFRDFLCREFREVRVGVERRDEKWLGLATTGETFFSSSLYTRARLDKIIEIGNDNRHFLLIYSFFFQILLSFHSQLFLYGTTDTAAPFLLDLFHDTSREHEL